MDGVFQEIHASSNPTMAITATLILGAQLGHLQYALLVNGDITLE
jgi:hypothetical protein